MATITDQILEQGSPVARTVRAYLHSDFSLAGSSTSDGGTGMFTITVATTAPHFVVAFDDGSGDSYNALVQANVTPVE